MDPLRKPFHQQQQKKKKERKEIIRNRGTHPKIPLYVE